MVEYRFSKPKVVSSILTSRINRCSMKACILYNPFTEDRWFRVYSEDKKYKDYELKAERLPVKILSKAILVHNNEQNYLDWDLRRKPLYREIIGEIIETKDIEGELLYNPITGKRHFRLKLEDGFRDYDLHIEDLEIEVSDSINISYINGKRIIV